MKEKYANAKPTEINERVYTHGYIPGQGYAAMNVNDPSRTYGRGGKTGGGSATTCDVDVGSGGDGGRTSSGTITGSSGKAGCCHYICVCKHGGGEEMKCVRVAKHIDGSNRVEEIFPYDPFEWIVSAEGVPNAEFLAYCRTLGDDAEVECGWIENDDGTFSPPIEEVKHE